VNAKSLLGVLSLGVGQNEEIKIIGDGADENEAVETIYSLITSDFEE
jgi:phosphocarrier protein